MGTLGRPGAAEVYRTMWDSFSGWCLGQTPRVTLANLSLQDLSKARKRLTWIADAEGPIFAP